MLADYDVSIRIHSTTCNLDVLLARHFPETQFLITLLGIDNDMIDTMHAQIEPYIAHECKDSPQVSIERIALSYLNEGIQTILRGATRMLVITNERSYLAMLDRYGDDAQRALQNSLVTCTYAMSRHVRDHLVVIPEGEHRV